MDTSYSQGISGLNADAISCAFTLTDNTDNVPTFVTVPVDTDGTTPDDQNDTILLYSDYYLEEGEDTKYVLDCVVMKPFITNDPNGQDEDIEPGAQVKFDIAWAKVYNGNAKDYGFGTFKIDIETITYPEEDQSIEEI